MLKPAARIWYVTGAWLATLALIVVTGVALGASVSTLIFFVAIGAAPALVFALVGGAPSPTVAEVLRTVHARDGR